MLDDEAIIRKVAAHMLGREGCQVETACHGREAVEMYRAAVQTGNPFDLGILDLTVPGGMGGEEAVQELCTLDPTARVIVSSGYADSATMAGYREAGFRALLPKPYRMDYLRQTLRQVLQDE